MEINNDIILAEEEIKHLPLDLESITNSIHLQLFLRKGILGDFKAEILPNIKG